MGRSKLQIVRSRERAWRRNKRPSLQEAFCDRWVERWMQMDEWFELDTTAQREQGVVPAHLHGRTWIEFRGFLYGLTYYARDMICDEWAEAARSGGFGSSVERVASALVREVRAGTAECVKP